MQVHSETVRDHETVTPDEAGAPLLRHVEAGEMMSLYSLRFEPNLILGGRDLGSEALVLVAHRRAPGLDEPAWFRTQNTTHAPVELEARYHSDGRLVVSVPWGDGPEATREIPLR